MSERYKVRDNVIPYFVTITVVGWIDALTRSDYKDIILDSLKYCAAKKGLVVHAWVIMSNHLHLVISATGDNEIPAIMRDFKKFTSVKVIEAIRHNPQESRREWLLNSFAFSGASNANNDMYQFWQAGYHPIALDSKEKVGQRLNYLHENPVRAGIVWDVADYKYSSAVDYYENQDGLLEVTLLF